MFTLFLPFPLNILFIFFSVIATFVSPFLSLAGLINPVAILIPHDCSSNTIVNITGNFSINSKQWALIPLNGLCPSKKGVYSVIILKAPEGNSTKSTFASNITRAYNIETLRSSSGGSHSSGSHSTSRSTYRSSSPSSRSSPFIIPGVAGRRVMNQNQIDYKNCVPFDGRRQVWKQIDRNNYLSGRNTNLLVGGKIWGRCRVLLLVATVSLFATIPLFFILICRDPRKIRTNRDVGVVLSLLIFLSFVLWIIVLRQIRDTDQLDTLSWSTSYFYPCAVSIYMSNSTDFGISVLVFTGGFVTLALVALSIAITFYHFERVAINRESEAAVVQQQAPIIEQDNIKERRQIPVLSGTFIPMPRWSRQRRYSSDVVPNAKV